MMIAALSPVSYFTQLTNTMPFLPSLAYRMNHYIHKNYRLKKEAIVTINAAAE